MMPIIRPVIVVLCFLVLAGCQTASLEDAAPKSVPAATAIPAAAQGSGADQVAASNAGDTTRTEQASSATIRRNPGIASVIPLEKTTPVENKEFVASGASRSGQYPNFGQQPKAANSQFSDQEKLAAEAEMTELLRNRASTPDARAQYEARLKELRALAANHGSDMQQEIEK
ncbi:hypothetical protein [uncultured Hoeflea sp.]|uniref:hypothetical protein n=1 Tax=uncultured Hoeflea sp. TaxID=538666 RepID=UPI0030ECB297